jgi:DNA-directed RNA polymerase subunit RPC12/RpoP
MVKRLVVAVIGVGILAWMLGLVEARYVFAPLLGLTIWLVGLASFRSLHAGGAHVPDGPPEPVDVSEERTTYWCSDCGAELLLLVRGAQTPPRHCGERMVERHEVARHN